MPKFETLREGDALPPRQLPPLKQIDVVRYAGASGDFNPIHTVPAAAQEAGLPSTIAHGMMSMGVLGSWLSDWIGSEGALEKFGARFAAMTFPGDVLTLSGIISVKTETPSPRVDLDLTVTKQDGTVTVKGWATVVWKNP
jgi:acyl dehydratase